MVCGCGWRWRRFNSSHICLIGFPSDDFYVNTIAVMFWFCRQFIVKCAVCGQALSCSKISLRTSIVDCRCGWRISSRLHLCYPEFVLTVFSWHKIWLPTPLHFLHDTIRGKSFITASIDANFTISLLKHKLTFIAEPDSRPTYQIPILTILHHLTLDRWHWRFKTAQQ